VMSVIRYFYTVFQTATPPDNIIYWIQCH
jgi:hypothetical protein